MTPLMLAASRSNMSSLVETFLNYEADPQAKDSRGFTALRLVWKSRPVGMKEPDIGNV